MASLYFLYNSAYGDQPEWSKAKDWIVKIKETKG